MDGSPHHQPPSDRPSSQCPWPSNTRSASRSNDQRAAGGQSPYRRPIGSDHSNRPADDTSSQPIIQVSGWLSAKIPWNRVARPLDHHSTHPHSEQLPDPPSKSSVMDVSRQHPMAHGLQHPFKLQLQIKVSAIKQTSEDPSKVGQRSRPTLVKIG
ncbi:hypothetical protein ACLOJK_029287 [Asimina triloba]